jgi:hypothetical protein
MEGVIPLQLAAARLFEALRGASVCLDFRHSSAPNYLSWL